jgi:hypothetical protein
MGSGIRIVLLAAFIPETVRAVARMLRFIR